MYPDFLTCGLCADEFPLSQILDFIVHKTSCLQASDGQSLSTGDPAMSSRQTLSCYFCHQDFHTARGILHHLQLSHHVEIVQQKTPWSPPYTDRGQQATPLPSLPLSPCAADNRPAPRAATATTVSDCRSTVVSHIPNEVSSVSSAKEAAMPVTCARLASTEGTTICCNGSECQVTINPPRPQTTPPPPPKKCCSSVVPKKRTRHMQEHGAEDMEQCALETLCSLGGQLFVGQKSRPGGHKRAKKSSKPSRKRRPQCILSCERERVCVTKASEESESEAKEEERCQTCEEAGEEEGGEECRGDGDSAVAGRGKPAESRVEIYSVEKDSITSRKTVIMNSGMTVTVQPTEAAAPSNGNDSSSPVIPAKQGRSIPSEDASRESAHILAELMYHATHPGDQVPVHSLQTTAAADGRVPVSGGGLQSALSDAVADLLPLDPHISSADAVNFSNSLCPMFMNPSVPTSLELPVSVPGSSASLQGGVDQPLDMQHLPDLDALTAAIQHFPALDHLSQHAAVLPMLHVPVSSSGSNNGGFGSGEDSGEGRKGAGGKKRRYPTSRPYKCSECDQAFNQPIHLKKHMSKHTGVKPFKCDLCQYSTVERSHLKAHNRIHTGEKPFQCQFCSYATAQNSTLKVHLRRHHQDRQQTGSMGTTTATTTTTTTTSAKDR